jgi:nicotinamide-nucleotide amidase
LASPTEPRPQPVVAEIISIGDELTSGQRLDTNSRWLSRELGELGIHTLYHSTVGDELEPMRSAFRIAAGRAAVVLVTGGLGPTADDLTRQALADVAGSELVLHEPSLRWIEKRFRLRGREMTPNNRQQALHPAGSIVIPNPNGTAPGIRMRIAVAGTDKLFFAMPGVPAEMEPMFRDQVVPELRRTFPQSGIVVHRTICCFGAGESEIESRLPDLIRRGRIPVVGITASSAIIKLRIAASGPDASACAALIAPVEETIRSTLGDLVFGTDDDTPGSVTIEMMRRSNRTLAVMDAGTGGTIITELDAAEKDGLVYRGALLLRNLKYGLEDHCREIQRQLEVTTVLGVGPVDESEAGSVQPYVILDHESLIAGSFRPIRNSTIASTWSALYSINQLRKHLLNHTDREMSGRKPGEKS